MVFSTHSRSLPLRNSLGAFRHKQDLHGRQHDLEVLHDAGVGYVHQVHDQLVVGGGVVLAVDLGIAGQAGFGLQAQGELGQLLLVLGGDLGALGAGANQAHGAAQDIEQLGQLIYAAGADDFAHRRYAVVVAAGRKPGHAVLLGVHAHTAELEDVEPPAVLGQAHLLVEHRAAVRGLDGDGRDDEDRAEHHQRKQRDRNIHQALDEQVLRLGRIAADFQHRQVEHMHRVCAGHDRVANARDDKHRDIVRHAMFKNDVAVMAVDTAHKYCFYSVQHGKIVDALLRAGGQRYGVLVIQAVLADELFHALAVVINNGSRLPGESGEVPPVRQQRPQGGQQHLPGQRGHAGQNVGQVFAQQPDDHIHDEVADPGRQELRIDDLGDTLHRHEEGIVHTPEHDVQHKEQRHDQQIALGVKRRGRAPGVV